MLIWDVDRLVKLSSALPWITIQVDSVRELDEAYWSGVGNERMTCREVVGHARLMNEADLAFPIILSANGRVMDGMHRVAKASLEGRAEIEAVQFEEDPEPDYMNLEPSELTY
jgi:hypothetical protein